MPPVPHHLIVEVWARGEPGHADVPDHVALPDPAALVHARAEVAEVCVAGDEAVRMLDLHGVAEASLRPPMDDDAVGRRHDRRPRIRGIVDAAVRPDRVQHRVASGGRVAARDPAVRERLEEEGPAHGLTFEVEVRPTPVSVGTIMANRCLYSLGCYCVGKDGAAKNSAASEYLCPLLHAERVTVLYHCMFICSFSALLVGV